MSVYLLGAGPGDPGLLTLRARDLLQKADVVIYDALASPQVLEFARPGAELLYVGKVAGNHALPQPEINRLLQQKAGSLGPDAVIVRLKGGDPYIFGRGGEEAEALSAAGIPFEEVPGISSAIAAPAYAGIPLTHRDMASSLSIITGHERPDRSGSAINWSALAQSASTLVFVMGMKNLPHICRNLIEAGMSPEMPAAVIYRGTTPMQRSLVASVATLPAEARAAGFSNPAVIVVGKVCSLARSLDWFGKKPLLGKSVVVTRSREQASGMAGKLAALGAHVIQCPTIAIRGLADYDMLDDAIKKLPTYDWLIFTSANGVEYFWRRLAQAGHDSRAIGCAKVGAIGPATAAALEGRGIIADFVPERFVAECVAGGLIARMGENAHSMRVLLPRAASARDILPQTLEKAGATVDVCPCYETVPESTASQDVLELLEKGKLSCVTFGSSSTVENFLRLVPADILLRHPETLLAAIGPVTAGTLEKHGLKADIMPEQYTIPALVSAIVDHYAGQQS